MSLVLLLFEMTLFFLFKVKNNQILFVIVFDRIKQSTRNQRTKQLYIVIFKETPPLN